MNVVRSGRACWMGLFAVWVLCGLLLGCDQGGAGEAPKTPAKPKGPVTAAEAGKLYMRACMSCHGTGGKGDGHRSRMFGGLPDFTSAEFHASRTDEALTTTILNGQGRMPAFKHRFDEREIGALVKHVRTFQATPAPSDKKNP